MFIKKSINIKLTSVLFASCLLLSSCSNFLNGKQLKVNIENSIEYATSPERDIKIFSKEGKISPSSTQKYKKSNSINLNFFADTDYCFAYWSVKIGNERLSIEESNKYFIFDDYKSADTTVQFIEYPESNELITIEPVCIVRPVVLKNTPIDIKDGVFRDSKITVLFDHDMDPESIYYTDEEVEELRIKLLKSNIDKGHDIEASPELKLNDDPTEEYSLALWMAFSLMGDTANKPELYDIDYQYDILLYSDTEEGKKYFGYILDNEMYFKNIRIIDLINGKNVINRFCEPKFENPRLLTIKTFGEFYPLRANRSIYVEISKNMFSKIDGYAVTLDNNKTWDYTINDRFDDIPPILKESLMGAITSTHKYENIHKAKELPSDRNLLSKIITRTNKLRIYNISVTDTDSLPDSNVYFKFKRIKDINFNDVSEKYRTITTLLEPDDNVKVISAENIILDLTEYTDGVYQGYIEVRDKNENINYSYNYDDDHESVSEHMYYYFILSKDCVPIKENSVFWEYNSAKREITITIAKSNNMLLGTLGEVSYKVNGDTVKNSEISGKYMSANDTGVSFTIDASQFPKNSETSININYSDIFGRNGVYTIKVKPEA